MTSRPSRLLSTRILKSLALEKSIHEWSLTDYSTSRMRFQTSFRRIFVTLPSFPEGWVLSSFVVEDCLVRLYYYNYRTWRSDFLWLGLIFPDHLSFPACARCKGVLVRCWIISGWSIILSTTWFRQFLVIILYRHTRRPHFDYFAHPIGSQSRWRLHCSDSHFWWIRQRRFPYVSVTIIQHTRLANDVPYITVDIVFRNDEVY